MKKLKKLLLFEGILSFILAILFFYVLELDHSIYLLVVPFHLIGKGLRWLSLSSNTGNMIAITLYSILSLIPVIFFLWKRRRSDLKPGDYLLLLISIYTFFMLYQFINPHQMIRHLPPLLAKENALPMIKLAYAIVFFTLWFSYLLLRSLGILNIMNGKDKTSYLCNSLQKLLITVSIGYTFLLGYFTSFQMFLEISQSNKESDPLLPSMAYSGSRSITILFAIIKFVLIGLPILYTVLTMVTGIELLEAMSTHQMDQEMFAVMKVGKYSKKTVFITVISNIIVNGMQLLLMRQLNHTNFRLELSVIPLIVAFAAMILSEYFKETKELYEDNQMII